VLSEDDDSMLVWQNTLTEQMEKTMSDAAQPNANASAAATTAADGNAYRGYRITVTPKRDHDDLWDFDYTIAPVDGKGQTHKRSNTAGGHASESIAREAGIEVARVEIDNLIAMQGG
jgi:hypothetical protein